MLLGAVLAREVNSDVQQRYIDSARTSASLITQVGIQPLLTDQELADGLTPGEVATIDDRLQGASLSKDVVRIKVWNSLGTIIYSDNHALIGHTYPIDDDLGDALKGTARASVTDGHDEENSGDNLPGPLVQAYVPLTFNGSSRPSGAFEVYLPYAPVQAAIDHEMNQLYLVLAAGLVLLYAALFPVAILADRWRRRLVHEAETTALANLAVLERLNRLKSDFFTRASHQFRTALVGIQGFSEVIKDSNELDVGEVKSFATDIYNEAARLDRAFSDMIELDRMETGQAALTTTRVNIDQLVKNMAERIGTENPSHTLVLRLDAANTTVPCDRERVAQALTNLLTNAIKFSPAGSDVEVSTELGDDMVTIGVKDHGPGLPRDFADSLLTGYQHPQATDDGAPHYSSGTGLGLPMARQIIEMHGGRLWFDSMPGVGTMFHFTLPLQLRPSRPLAAAVRTPPGVQTAPVRTPSSLSQRR